MLKFLLFKQIFLCQLLPWATCLICILGETISGKLTHRDTIWIGTSKWQNSITTLSQLFLLFEMCNFLKNTTTTLTYKIYVYVNKFAILNIKIRWANICIFLCCMTQHHTDHASLISTYLCLYIKLTKIYRQLQDIYCSEIYFCLETTRSSYNMVKNRLFTGYLAKKLTIAAVLYLQNLLNSIWHRHSSKRTELDYKNAGITWSENWLCTYIV